MRLVILGLIGAGKGTQAGRVAEAHGIVHISTGDMFRAAAAAGTELGRRAQGHMERGELVPDEVTIDMLLDRVGESDAQAGSGRNNGTPQALRGRLSADAATRGRDKTSQGIVADGGRTR